MASQINLLPEELRIGTGFGNLVRRLKRTVYFWAVFLIIFAVLAVASIVLFSNRANDLENKNADLESSITGLQASEQKLVLLKDRLLKLKDILAARSNYDKINKFDTIVGIIPSDSHFMASSVDNEKTSLELVAKSSNGLLQILNSLDKSGFQRIILRSLAFDPLIGYEITLNFLNSL